MIEIIIVLAVIGAIIRAKYGVGGKDETDI